MRSVYRLAGLSESRLLDTLQRIRLLSILYTSINGTEAAGCPLPPVLPSTPSLSRPFSLLPTARIFGPTQPEPRL